MDRRKPKYVRVSVDDESAAELELTSHEPATDDVHVQYTTPMAAAAPGSVVLPVTAAQVVGQHNEWLAPYPAILVRQRMQTLEQFVPACEKSNRYNIAATSFGLANREPPLTDQEYWTQPQIGFIREESECCCRVCCGAFRELRLGVYRTEQASGGSGPLLRPDFMMIERPFRCTCVCCCVMLNPQEATFYDPNGNKQGSAKVDFRCAELLCKGYSYIAVSDGAGNVHNYIRHVLPLPCNGCRNCCAPMCCNQVWEGDILDNRGTMVGNYRDTYPGNVGLRCLSDASNFSLTFPARASTLEKANLLGALMLTEYLFHEKKRRRNG